MTGKRRSGSFKGSYAEEFNYSDSDYEPPTKNLKLDSDYEPEDLSDDQQPINNQNEQPINNLNEQPINNLNKDKPINNLSEDKPNYFSNQDKPNEINLTIFEDIDKKNWQLWFTMAIVELNYMKRTLSHSHFGLLYSTCSL